MNHRYHKRDALIVLLTLFWGCFAHGLRAQTPNTWTQKASIRNSKIISPTGAEPTPRSEAVGFAIGNTGYIGMGQDGSASILNDFWAYDPATDTWTQKADFGGEARYGAVGFSIGSKGYIGTGGNRVYSEFVRL